MSPESNELQNQNLNSNNVNPMQSTSVQSQVNFQTVNNTPVMTNSTVTQMSTNPQTSQIKPTPMPVNPQTSQIRPTPMPVNPQTSQIKPTPMPVNPQSNIVSPNIQNVVNPTQNVINTSRKKNGHLLLFVAIILIALFIYYIDDVLLYFNQNFTPVVSNNKPENSSANLIEGFIKIDENDSYIKIKGIKFSNVKKSNDNAIFLSYVSDKNYTNISALNINIKIFNEAKEEIYSEKFNISESIEANVNRQYKILLNADLYDDAYYALIAN